MINVLSLNISEKIPLDASGEYIIDISQESSIKSQFDQLKHEHWKLFKCWDYSSPVKVQVTNFEKNFEINQQDNCVLGGMKVHLFENIEFSTLYGEITEGLNEWFPWFKIIPKIEQRSNFRIARVRNAREPTYVIT
jgi:hypothetical protein